MKKHNTNSHAQIVLHALHNSRYIIKGRYILKGIGVSGLIIKVIGIGENEIGIFNNC